MNGDTIREIKSLLAEAGTIKTPTALRLTLQLMTDIYEKQVEEIGERKKLDRRVETIEKTSIVIWMQKHPKATALLVLSYFSLVAFVDMQALVEWIKGILLKLI
jgi:hypothetical protein